MYLLFYILIIIITSFCLYLKKDKMYVNLVSLITQ